MAGDSDPIEYGKLDASDGEINGVDRVLEWEEGLPNADDLTPLSQLLVPPELASAFSITPEPAKTILDVHHASQNTLSSLRRSSSNLVNSPPPPFEDPRTLEAEESSRGKRSDENSSSHEEMDNSERALKRPRLVWTPNLHKRFVDVVAHIGIKNAVPKMIMQLMNVEGLTRENVASHLQKYRLYLKRMQGLSSDSPSVSDPLFESTPVPQSLRDNVVTPQHQQPQPQHPVPMPIPYSVPTMIPMPMYGIPHHNGAMGIVPVNNGHNHGYDANNRHHMHQQPHLFGGYGEQRSKDWANGSKFSTSAVNYPHHVSPNDK